MKRFLKYSIIFILIMIIFASVFFTLFFALDTTSFAFDRNKVFANSGNLVIVNEVGTVLNENTNNDFTTLADINLYTVNAFISIEDKDFFNHKGVNYKRMIKAGYNNIINGSIKEGASTISQQLIKNTHLSHERTFKRKLQEIKLAKEMEKKLSKKEIFEGYLNAIYFGENAYGIADASRIYFNKTPKELTLAESATLAGLIKAPATYSPIKNKVNCLKRRNLVLKEMLSDGKITNQEYEKAKDSDIEVTFTKIATKDKNKNLYNKAVVDEACKLLNLSKEELYLGNYKITTYQNENIQKSLNDKLSNKNYFVKNKNGFESDGLAIVMDNKTGGVVAFAGKSDYIMKSEFNRQPGSAIKPILVFAPALENGAISPSTQILDDKINIDGYSPHNVGGGHAGYVSVRESVSKSLNIPSVKIMQKIGIDNAKEFAKNSGINFDKKDKGYAIALGGFTEGISLKSLTNSYLPFANGGNFQESLFIKEIKNASGITIFKNNQLKHKIMGDDTAYLMTDLLIDGVKNGTSRKLASLPYAVAGKTGTVAVKGTNYNTDAISIAYTTNHTMGVWLGNYSMDDKKSLEGSNNGGTFATAIIKDCFIDIYKNEKPDCFIMPSSVEYVEIDNKLLNSTHEIALCSSSTPERYKVKELFSKRYLPSIVSTIFENYKLEDFSVSYLNNMLNISFLAEDFITYDIYINDGQERKLKRIEGTTGEINYNERLNQTNEKAQIYIKYFYNHDKRSFISNKQTIYVLSNNTNFFNNLEKKNDFAFLFGS